MTNIILKFSKELPNAEEIYSNILAIDKNISQDYLDENFGVITPEDNSFSVIGNPAFLKAVNML